MNIVPDTSTGKVPQGRPKDPQKAVVILEAAGCLFLENGFVATSMDAVAQRAGVSKQTLYSHFEGKDDLFKQVIKSKVDHYNFAKLSESLTGDLEKDLNRLGQFFLGLILDEEAVGMMRVVIGESGKYRKIAELFYQMGPERVTKALQGYLYKQQEGGVIQLDDPYEKAVLFLNILKGEWHMQALMGMRPQITPEQVEKHVKTSVRQFMVLLRQNFD